jgi:nitrate reductase molybdenum cofactor assembly chaperone NarJ/NarW
MTGPAHTIDAHRAAVWQCAALLLAYPDERLLADLPTVRRILALLPDDDSRALNRLVDHVATTPLVELQSVYVEMFDSRRRHNLYLTYFAHGDTRKRGLALLRFKQAYLSAGFVVDAAEGGELPDHLCVVLEFAATVDADRGRQLLIDHRAGLELLRLSLIEHDSPWAGALEAVCATLPALRGDERDAVRRLAADGPPAEEVGLSPYGGPAFDALLHEATALPMPVLREGAR